MNVCKEVARDAFGTRARVIFQAASLRLLVPPRSQFVRAVHSKALKKRPWNKVASPCRKKVKSVNGKVTLATHTPVFGGATAVP